MFRKPPLFYAAMVLMGIIVGEVLSSVLPLFVPHSGALDAITYRFSLGFSNITLDLYFLIVSFGLKVKLSLLGVVAGLTFLLIARFL
ncbi:MAG: DUF4321 domain-containing protein [Thermotogae bacterium]|nr:DUF4321 domain-containing protein [Thermotogota bacterium]